MADLENEEYGPELITLIDDEGNEHEFEIIDTLELGEQRYIAEPVVNAGGGLLVADKDLTPQWVHEHVPDLLADHERLAEFGRKAWEYGIRNAAEIMARHVLQLAEPSK